MGQSRRDVLQNTLDAVAHEIRNPLLAIGGFAKRLARQAREEERGRQYARIIAEESTRLEHILTEILDYSHAYVPVFVEKDLILITGKVLDEFEGIFRERDIRVERHFPQEPVQVPIDIDGITRVFRQLFKNAIDMTGQAQNLVTVSVQPLQHTGQVHIGISDTGRPIPDDIRDALLDSNLSTKTFGQGLGLPMVRKIVEGHNGRIALNFQEGHGNTVDFYLPTSHSP
jgi:signal transduction histidine kinase